MGSNKIKGRERCYLSAYIRTMAMCCALPEFLVRESPDLALILDSWPKRA